MRNVAALLSARLRRAAVPAPSPSPKAVEPQCDFNAVGRCVGPLGHPGTWHKNAEGVTWFGVNFDPPSPVARK